MFAPISPFGVYRAQAAQNASDQNKSPASEHLDQIKEKGTAVTTDLGWERDNTGMRRELEPETDVSEPTTLKNEPIDVW